MKSKIRWATGCLMVGFAVITFMSCGGTSTSGDGEVDGDAVVCSGCLIGDACYEDGEVNPTNPCQICDADASPNAWSDNDGAACNDGEFCTVSDTCTSGVCSGDTRSCDDGIDCNGTETCNETAERCDPGESQCGDDEICDAATDTCVTLCTGCVIEGTCYGTGQANPLDTCRICDPDASDSSWTDNEGGACDDGEYCTVNDTCASGTCSGEARTCDDGVSCNGTETCNETDDQCDPGETQCGDDEICDVVNDECVPACTGCVIDGTCFGGGQTNPANACQICDVDSSTTAWTDNDGAACDDDLFCTVGDTCASGACSGEDRVCEDGVDCNGTETCNEDDNRCEPGESQCGSGEVCDVFTDTCLPLCLGCTIDGVCYYNGSRNPLNPCEICNVDASDTSWTADDGYVCGTDRICEGNACRGDLHATCDADAPCLSTLACDSDSATAGDIDACIPSSPIFTFQIQTYSPCGGSFTALGGRLLAITSGGRDMNASAAPHDHTLYSMLYNGEGLGGTILASPASDYLPSGAMQFGFDFTPFGLELVFGNSYTFVMTNDTARWGARFYDDLYSGGMAYRSGTAVPTSDACLLIDVGFGGAVGPECRVPSGGSCTSSDECAYPTVCDSDGICN